MFSPFCSARTFAPLVALSLLALTAFGGAASAEARPHTWRGTGQFVSANDFVSEGNATHLGLFHEAGHVKFMQTDDPAVLQFKGCSIHTAANGDELHEIFTGSLNVQTGAATAAVTFVGGTGRFVGASGTGVLSAEVLPDGSLEFAGQGTIDY
jgi:hypothetical protein